jgi:hypothetical protein
MLLLWCVLVLDRHSLTMWPFEMMTVAFYRQDMSRHNNSSTNFGDDCQSLNLTNYSRIHKCTLVPRSVYSIMSTP